MVETDTLSFLPAPLFNRVKTIETTIPTTGDPLDIYLPAGSHKTDSLPVALFLQGANVDKSNYSIFDFVFGGTGDELDSNVVVTSEPSPDLFI